MVAYSFKRRFVAPIRTGLGDQQFVVDEKCGAGCLLPVLPKRQTIRADRKRHARPGEELQLYCGKRTKQCFLIGRARCICIEPIRFLIRNDALTFDRFDKQVKISDAFARQDGFADAKEMHDFWRKEHGLGVWHGVLIRWQPL